MIMIFNDQTRCGTSSILMLFATEWVNDRERLPRLMNFPDRMGE